jgi:hypothetical protein
MLHPGSAALAAVLLAGAAALAAQAPTASSKADELLDATRKGDAGTVRRLLDEGVNVDTKFRYGRTALAFACDRGHVEVVTLLLERGADVNAEDSFYHATPLTWAVNPAMGRTPQHLEIVRLLLAHNPKGRNQALMGAVSANDAPMVKVILDAGGLPAGLLSDALDAASRTDHKDLVALLTQAGATPRVEFTIAPADLARYAGTYNSPTGVELTLSVAEGHLVSTAMGQKLTLLARDRTTFGVAEVPGLTATFTIDNGNVTAVTIGQGGGGQTFSRVAGGK